MEETTSPISLEEKTSSISLEETKSPFSLTLITINIKKDGAGQPLFRQVYKRKIEDLKPDIIFLQEKNSKADLEVLEDYFLHFNGKNKKEAVVGINPDGEHELCSATRENQRLKENLGEMKGPIEYKYNFKEYFMDRLELRKIMINGKEILICSWHGHQKGIKDNEKKERIHHLYKALISLEKPFVIGGDFNLDKAKILEVNGIDDSNLAYVSGETEGKNIDYFAFGGKGITVTDATMSKYESMYGNDYHNLSHQPIRATLTLTIEEGEGEGDGIGGLNDRVNDIN